MPCTLFDSFFFQQNGQKIERKKSTKETENDSLNETSKAKENEIAFV